MADQLYQAAIVGLARAATGKGRLDRPGGTATVDNPLCGDRVTIDVRMDGDHVVAFGHLVRGCLLCEAAASVIGQHVLGSTRAELTAASDAVRALLKDAATSVPWPELEAFTPIRVHRSRHSCVLLPFEALTKALAAAE
jgi:nitrogen fixation NifU-like protein